MKKSIWQNNLKNKFPQLEGEDHVDIAIIGGGICGITTAYLLQNYGLSIGVYEGDTLAASNTGKSTGNLYMMVDTPLQELIKRYDHETISNVFSARQGAVDLIEEIINENKIECSFKRVPWTLFSAVEETDELIIKEYELAKELNIKSEWLDNGHPELAPFKGRVGLKVLKQAQFDPYNYVTQLAHKINSHNCKIYENTRIQGVKENNHGEMILKTSNGTIKTKTVIHATHTPLGFSPLQTVVAPYREYGIAQKIDQPKFKDGIYWGYYSKEKLYSFRNHSQENKNYLIMIGSPHKVGQGESKKSLAGLWEDLEKLELKENKDETVEWSGQHFRSSDHLPFIGHGFENNTLLCTGFSTDGLVYGTLSAMIFRDIILNNTNTYKDIFKPHRLSSLSSKEFLNENFNVLQQYVVDYFKTNESVHPEVGQGCILSYKGHKYAVSKNENEELLVSSAVCSHLGCIVHWNDSEKSWDCPCHGSRFTDRGKVIEGPALKDLGEGNLEDS
ncbi:MAG TPA: FAD-dependent oxidoreductase [Bacteriovoracaceae bacterium]|nr:FAD-dependent oxidoreductase [Bacteriovoracaceae bacterium]